MARDSWYSRHFRSPFLSPADRFSFPADALLLLPCGLRSLPGSGKFFSIMSHMETLSVAPDGYSLGFSSSSIPSGRSPLPGLSGRLRPSSASGGSGRQILPPAASLPLPAGGRGPCPRGARSSRACRLRTGGGCGGSAGPKPTHAVGALHGGGAAATSYPLKPDRVVRSRGRSGMGSNIAWHRRHNDSVD